MPKLVPFDKDEFDKLIGYDKVIAKNRYADWREKQREQDKKETAIEKRKKDNMINRKQRKSYYKKWKENPKNKAKIKMWGKRGRLKKCIELHGHPPEIVKKIKDWYYVNYKLPEVIKLKNKRYRKKNREKINKKARERYDNQKNNTQQIL